MKVPQIVIDTNIFVSAIRSRNGASFKLVSLIGTERFDIHISVPIVFEYEEALKRHIKNSFLTKKDITDFLDYICFIGSPHDIFFLWRPQLKDPKDDLVLELAVTASCRYIITHNLKDFEGTKEFGVKAITPQKFLKMIGEAK